MTAWQPEPDGEQEFGLVMPFVVCKSQGGPHDDDSFVAGLRLGRIDQLLSTDGAGWTGLIQERDLPQLDLIAMRYGCQVTKGEPVNGWVHVEVRRWIA